MSNPNPNPNKSLLKIKKFIYDKKNFCDILNIYKNKIIFPKEFIADIKKINGLTNLYHYIEGYNSAIKEARYLSTKLKNVSSWGYIFNSYNSWYNSINIVGIEIKKYQSLILNMVEENQLLIEYYIGDNFTYSNWLFRLIVFMYLIKDSDDSNNFICERFFDKIKLVNNLNLEQAEKLLIIFSNSKLIQKKYLYYTIPDLYKC